MYNETTEDTETNATPTIAGIGLDLFDSDDAIDAAHRTIVDARSVFIRRIGDFRSESDAFKPVVDVLLPELDAAETETVTQLDAHLGTLAEQQRFLEHDLDWTPDLMLVEQREMHEQIPAIESQVRTMTATDLAAFIRTTLAHGDKARIAAIATLAPVIEARTFPREPGSPLSSGASQIAGLIAECRQKTRDRKTAELIERLQRIKTKAQELRGDVIQRRNAHEPGSLGGPLDKKAFGLYPPKADRYDPETLAIRAGQ
jgi:hypothetical protein